MLCHYLLLELLGNLSKPGACERIIDCGMGFHLLFWIFHPKNNDSSNPRSSTSPNSPFLGFLIFAFMVDGFSFCVQ